MENSELSKYKLRFEKPRVKRKWISQEAIKKMAKEERKAEKEKNKKALHIDIRTYVNPWVWGLPLAVSLATTRGTTALVLNITVFETVITAKRVKR